MGNKSVPEDREHFWLVINPGCTPSLTNRRLRPHAPGAGSGSGWLRPPSSTGSRLRRSNPSSTNLVDVDLDSEFRWQQHRYRTGTLAARLPSRAMEGTLPALPGCYRGHDSPLARRRTSSGRNPPSVTRPRGARCAARCHGRWQGSSTLRPCCHRTRLTWVPAASVVPVSTPLMMAASSTGMLDG